MNDAHGLVGEPLLALVQAVSTLRARCRQDSPSKDADVELVHDLRVAMRRLRSVLRPMRALYGARVCDEAEETLRTWLLTTSDLRDEEVLRETLSKIDLRDATAREALRTWMVGRARRERGARTRTLVAVSTGDSDALDVLEKRLVRGPKREIDASAFAADMIDRALRKLEERSEGVDASDGDAMHRARIGAKKLRYAAALLGGRSGTEAEQAAPVIATLAAIERGASRIQKRLGDLHDLDEAMIRMRRAWGLDQPIRAVLLEALAKRRAHVGVRAARELVPEVGELRVLFSSVTDWGRSPTPLPPDPPSAVEPVARIDDAPSNADAVDLDASG